LRNGQFEERDITLPASSQSGQESGRQNQSLEPYELLEREAHKTFRLLSRIIRSNKLSPKLQFDTAIQTSHLLLALCGKDPDAEEED
jgi:hypothetical protein